MFIWVDVCEREYVCVCVCVCLRARAPLSVRERNLCGGYGFSVFVFLCFLRVCVSMNLGDYFFPLIRLPEMSINQKKFIDFNQTFELSFLAVFDWYNFLTVSWGY